MESDFAETDFNAYLVSSDVDTLLTRKTRGGAPHFPSQLRGLLSKAF